MHTRRRPVLGLFACFGGAASAVNAKSRLVEALRSEQALPHALGLPAPHKPSTREQDLLEAGSSEKATSAPAISACSPRCTASPSQVQGGCCGGEGGLAWVLFGGGRLVFVAAGWLAPLNRCARNTLSAPIPPARAHPVRRRQQPAFWRVHGGAQGPRAAPLPVLL